MTSMRHAPSLLFILALGLLACAPTRPQTTASSAPTRPVQSASRTLVMLARQEPTTLSATLLIALGIGENATRRPFNAALAMLDGEERPVPYLAEALPQLDTDTWRVSPDGTMETTYHLRPGLTWHDGAPLTATDFVFARQVYTSPEFGTATSPPHTLMAEVRAQDDRTVVIEWRGLYAGAGSLVGLGGAGASPSFAPLPSHLLTDAFTQDSKGFVNLPFWTVGYVGAGPYRLANWEPGASIDGVAFDGHALGRPKIDRIRMLFSSDPNTALSTLLAGDAQMAIDDSIGLDQGVALQQDWAPQQEGTVLYVPAIARYIRVQLRPEYAKPAALLDPAMRMALAYTIDKPAINESVFYGAALLSDSMLPPNIAAEAGANTGIPTYPHDPARAAQILRDAGYAKDADGFYSSATEGRLDFELKNITSPRNDAERTVLANGWRQIGLQIDEANFRPGEAQDGQALSTFRSLTPTGGVTDESRFLYFLSTNITSPVNNWVGSNRGGWSNAEFDRIIAQWSRTLAADQRTLQLVQAATIVNQELPAIPLYYAPSAVAYAAALQGIAAKDSGDTPDWNMYEWELR